MIVWNILRKIILIPVIIVLTPIEWRGTFLTGIANMVIGLIALLLIVIAGLSAMTGIAGGTERLRMVGIIGAVELNLIEYL